eukprot:6464158-Pyramimonas_sp.AAC.1
MGAAQSPHAHLNGYLVDHGELVDAIDYGIGTPPASVPRCRSTAPSPRGARSRSAGQEWLVLQ